MTDREILTDLVRGTKCACTNSKRARMSFCKPCYSRLPRGIQTDLYTLDGTYPTAYRRALTALGFEEPSGNPPDRPPTPISTPHVQTQKQRSHGQTTETKD